MKFTLFLLTALVLIVAACNKDKFLTKPTIRIKSINSDFVPLNGTYSFTLECTDKEGDVQDSVIIIKQRLNKRVVATIRDTIRYKFPPFPKTPRTQIQVMLEYQNIISASNPPFIPGSTPPQRELDTLVLRLAVKDLAGNTSDTITTAQVIVFRQ
ncbi:MAG: hypothetical protein ABIR30_00830 [Chitinophagaceae bacterium]